MVGKLVEFSGFKKILDWLDQLEHLKFPFGVQCASVRCCRLGVLGSWVCWESQACHILLKGSRVPAACWRCLSRNTGDAADLDLRYFDSSNSYHHACSEPREKLHTICEGLEVFKYLPTIPLFVSLSSPKPGLSPWQPCPACPRHLVTQLRDRYLGWLCGDMTCETSDLVVCRSNCFIDYD